MMVMGARRNTRVVSAASVVVACASELCGRPFRHPFSTRSAAIVPRHLGAGAAAGPEIQENCSGSISGLGFLATLAGAADLQHYLFLGVVEFLRPQSPSVVEPAQTTDAQTHALDLLPLLPQLATEVEIGCLICPAAPPARGVARALWATSPRRPLNLPCARPVRRCLLAQPSLTPNCSPTPILPFCPAVGLQS